MKTNGTLKLNQTMGLAELSDACKIAGATASTVIHSKGNVVVFYKDAHGVEVNAPDIFDELHIQPTENASILIAVFYENATGPL